MRLEVLTGGERRTARKGKVMTLWFVSAILPDLTLEEVMRFASSVDFDCVELMCWPPEKLKDVMPA